MDIKTSMPMSASIRLLNTLDFQLNYTRIIGHIHAAFAKLDQALSR